MARPTTEASHVHTCNEGWVCEAHPEKGWPHPAAEGEARLPGGDCLGPGMPCKCGIALVKRVNICGVCRVGAHKSCFRSGCDCVHEVQPLVVPQKDREFMDLHRRIEQRILRGAFHQ